MRVAVLGAGTMGAQIAAHCANIGLRVLLLDIVPKEEKFRNKLAKDGIDKALKVFPPAFYIPEFKELIEIGNFEDDFNKIGECDWIIEAVVEDFDIKKKLFEKVDKFRKKRSIVSTNTSGISINSLKKGRSDDFRKHFLGTHFFNPPRYMKLLEIIPGDETIEEVVKIIEEFAKKNMGKGVVFAKDSPNFIANRIGNFSIMHTIYTMLEEELSIEEVDAYTGRAIGRPRTATFGTIDLIGIDVVVHVTKNTYHSLPRDPMRKLFIPPPFLEEMVKKGWTGKKVGQGFYKDSLVLDYKSMKYREKKKVSIPVINRALEEDDVRQRIKYIVWHSDFVWKILSNLLVYSAQRIPEISDSIFEVDNALKWGFNWRLGPFEIWDTLGIEEVVERLKKEKREVPPIVRELLSKGEKTFYKQEKKKKLFYLKGKYEPIIEPKEYIDLSLLKSEGKVIKENPEASLLDLGDGVACLEFHTKANTLGPGTIDMIFQSLDEVSKNFSGLIIGNQGRHFSQGANLALLLVAIQEEEWDEIEAMVRRFQKANMAIKYFEKPVIAVPFGRTLGGGCELCLHSAFIQASCETYMGFVEVGVGLLPASGGIKEMVCRRLGNEGEKDVNTILRELLETIGMAKVSMSGYEARKLGFLRDKDELTVQEDYLIYYAKQKLIEIIKRNYTPPIKKKIKLTGENGFAYLKMLIYNMREGGFITEHDAFIGEEIAKVLTGGDIPSGYEVEEEYLLDLEREAFLRLCGTQKTRERIEYMLKEKKPLRN